MGNSMDQEQVLKQVLLEIRVLRECGVSVPSSVDIYASDHASDLSGYYADGMSITEIVDLLRNLV